MNNYSDLVEKYRSEAGKKALQYCLNKGFLGWYVLDRLNTGRGPASKYIESGPYNSIHDALTKCTYDSMFVELLSPEEAEKFVY